MGTLSTVADMIPCQSPSESAAASQEDLPYAILPMTDMPLPSDELKALRERVAARRQTSIDNCWPR